MGGGGAHECVLPVLLITAVSRCIRAQGRRARARAAGSRALAWRASLKSAIQIPHPLKKPAPGALCFREGVGPTLLEQEGVRAWTRAEIARIGWRQHLPSAVPLRQGHDAAATRKLRKLGLTN